MEEWLEVVGFPNYIVSDHGKVKNRKFDKVLKPVLIGNGYTVTLYQDGRSYTKRIARLVAEGFSSEVITSSMVVRHQDDDISNNHIDNLVVEFRGNIIHERWIDHNGNVIREY